MKDKEIIQALKCCISKNNCTENCPYVDWKQNYFKCIEMSTLDAIDFIRRQRVEIDRLNKEVDRLSQCVLYHDGQMVDTIKEFAEKLKDISFYTLNDLKVVEVKDIDNLIKEMVGADNE